MSDQYPPSFAIEIDRPALVRYLRSKWLIMWTSFLGFFGFMLGGARAANRFEHARSGEFDVLSCLLTGFGQGLAAGVLLGFLIYLLLSHRTASRLAETLEVSVEGSFLHIRSQIFVLSDRKIHFRSIVDYTVLQGWMMKVHGIHALKLTTTSGGQYPFITILGIVDCLRIRDTLSHVDHLRENGS